MTDDLTRPIIGIENRTAQEAFDIMCDRIEQERLARKSPSPQPHTGRAGVTETMVRAACDAYGPHSTHDANETAMRAALNAALTVEPEAGEVMDGLLKWHDEQASRAKNDIERSLPVGGGALSGARLTLQLHQDAAARIRSALAP